MRPSLRERLPVSITQSSSTWRDIRRNPSMTGSASTSTGLRARRRLIYDFDEHELRVHFIVPARADLGRIDPMSADW